MADKELQAHEAVRRRSWAIAVQLYDQALLQLNSATAATPTANSNNNNSSNTKSNINLNNSNAATTNTSSAEVNPLIPASTSATTTHSSSATQQTAKERQITCLLGRAESLLELGRYDNCLTDVRSVLALLSDQNDCLASLARTRRWHVHALVKLKKFAEAELVLCEWIGALGVQQSFSDICKTLDRYRSLIQMMSGQKPSQKLSQARLDDEMSILDTKLDHWATNNLPLDKYSKLLSNKGLKKREAAAAAAAAAGAASSTTVIAEFLQTSTSSSSSSSTSSSSSLASLSSSSSSSSTSSSSPAASSPSIASVNIAQQNGNNSSAGSSSPASSQHGRVSSNHSAGIGDAGSSSASNSSISNANSYNGNGSGSNNSPQLSIAHVSSSSSSSSLSSTTANLVKTLEQLTFLQADNDKEPSQHSGGAEAGSTVDDDVEDKSDASDSQIKCSYCAITFLTSNELKEHCQTESHQTMIMSDEGRNWKWRPPPRGFTLDTYSLCEAYSESMCCQYANQCVEAHGFDELNEWNERFEYRRKRLQKACEKELYGKSYTEQILERWVQAAAPDRIMCEKVEGVLIKCEQELVTTISSKSSKREWIFNIQSQKPLKAVCLLQDAHRNHFAIKSIKSFDPQAHPTTLKSNQEWVSAQTSTKPKVTESGSELESIASSSENAWQVTIEFRTDIYGTFRQAVCFDFGQEPYLIRNVCVDVVPVADVERLEEIKRDLISHTATRWDVSNTHMFKYETNVPNHQKTEAYLQDVQHEHDMLERYPCPRALNFTLTQSTIVEKRLNPDNYRARTHELLYVEEIARYEQIARFNVRTKLAVTSNYILTPAGMATSTAKFSLAGELFALMQLSKDISEDTSAGRLILSSCLSVYISMPEDEGEKKSQKSENTNEENKRLVFEALIEDKGKNEIYLKLSAKCVEMLGLQSDTEIKVDIQFQLNRLPYCEWHNAVDKVTDFNILFPTTDLEPMIPWTPKKQWQDTAEPKLNAKQREAVNAITTNDVVKLPPILLIGPFGTGKTYTLAQAIKLLLLQEDAKILICTHSNSAADLYIREYLHPWIESGLKEATPLRVYYHKRWVATVNSVVQQYCITDGAGNFRRPTLEDIKKYRIVVVTLSISMELSDIGLQKGYFTHIFLDEAAQAMECEAIMPLALANENTRIVLAGDHMQMSPELFSAFAMERKLHISLLERLYNHYPSCFPCKILLCENYRAHEAIINFTSELFYEQKLISSGKQPRHDRFYPLTFFTTRGEDIQDKNSTAFYNNAEVYELVERVSELRKKWPTSWGKMNDASIGIMTPYADQVFRIRSELRKRRMGGISVERVLNVQGKQFRAVFLSTVRTRRTCLATSNISTASSTTSEDIDYGFLSNSKLLNTAITRAQSLVAVVGDPVALCSIGRCRKVWERFIEICDINKSLFGITWSYLRSQLDGVELKRAYVLNPLAPEFVPRALQPEAYLREQAAMFLISGHSTPGSNHHMGGSPAVGTPTHVHLQPSAIGPPQPNVPPHSVMLYGHSHLPNNLNSGNMPPNMPANMHGQPQQQQQGQVMHPALAAAAAAYNAAMAMMNHHHNTQQTQTNTTKTGCNGSGAFPMSGPSGPPAPASVQMSGNHMLGMRNNAQQQQPQQMPPPPLQNTAPQQYIGRSAPSVGGPPPVSHVSSTPTVPTQAPTAPGQYPQYVAWQQAVQQQQIRGSASTTTVGPAVNASGAGGYAASTVAGSVPQPQNPNSNLWGPPPQTNPWSVLPAKPQPPTSVVNTVGNGRQQQQQQQPPIPPSQQQPPQTATSMQQQRCGSVPPNALAQQQHQQQQQAANVYNKKPNLYGGGGVAPTLGQQPPAPPHGNFGVGFNQLQLLNAHGRNANVPSAHMPNGPISPMDPFMSRLPSGVGAVGQPPPPGLTSQQQQATAGLTSLQQQQQQQQQQHANSFINLSKDKEFQQYNSSGSNNTLHMPTLSSNNTSNSNNGSGNNNNLFPTLLQMPTNSNNSSNNSNNNNTAAIGGHKQQSPTVARYNQAQEYAMLLPPNMSIYEMAFEPKENQYNWYLKVLEMHGQEAANKFTEMLRHTMNNLIHHPLQPQQQQLPHILAAQQQQQQGIIKPPVPQGMNAVPPPPQINQLMSRGNDMLRAPSPQLLGGVNVAGNHLNATSQQQQQHAQVTRPNGGVGYSILNPLAGISGNPSSALLPLQQMGSNLPTGNNASSVGGIVEDAPLGADGGAVNFNQQIDLMFNSLMNGSEISQPILRDLLGMTGGNSVNNNSHVSTNGTAGNADLMHANQQQQQQHLYHQQQQLLQQRQQQQQPAPPQQAQPQPPQQSKMFPVMNPNLSVANVGQQQQQQQAQQQHQAQGNMQQPQQLLPTQLNFYAGTNAGMQQQSQKQHQQLQQQQQMLRAQQHQQQQQPIHQQTINSSLSSLPQHANTQQSATNFLGSANAFVRERDLMLCDTNTLTGAVNSVPLYRRQAMGVSNNSQNNSVISVNNNNDTSGLDLNMHFAASNSLFSGGNNTGNSNTANTVLKNNLSPQENSSIHTGGAANILVGIGGSGNLIEALFQSNNSSDNNKTPSCSVSTTTTNTTMQQQQQVQQHQGTAKYSNMYGNFKALHNDLDMPLHAQNYQLGNKILLTNELSKNNANAAGTGGNIKMDILQTVGTGSSAATTAAPMAGTTAGINNQRNSATNTTAVTQHSQQGYSSMMATPTATYAAVLSQGSHNHTHHGHANTHATQGAHASHSSHNHAAGGAGGPHGSSHGTHGAYSMSHGRGNKSGGNMTDHQYHHHQHHHHHGRDNNKQQGGGSGSKITESNKNSTNKENKNKNNSSKNHGNNSNSSNASTSNTTAAITTGELNISNVVASTNVNSVGNNITDTERASYSGVRELGQGTNGYYNYFQ